MAAETIQIDVSKALADIARLKGGLADVKTQISQVDKAADAAFDEGFAVGMVDAINDLQREYAELKQSATTLKSALRGATDPTLIKQYTQSIGQLEAGMKRLETTGKAAGVNLKQANKDAGTGKQVFEGFFGAFTKATLIIAAITAVKEFASQAITLATGVERAQKQFQAFTGDAGKAAEIVGTLQSFANQKILNSQEVFDAGKGLLAFGETADNLVPVLSRVADISRATGKNFGELTTIYGKARAAGVLYAEDINQLVDAGIPIIGEFAKQMGVSTGEVKKLASEGKISFEELQLAFFNLTEQGGKFAGQAEAGITAADRFDVAWTSALTKVGVVLKPAWDFVLNSLSDILNSVTALGDSKGFEDFGRKFFNFFSEVNPLFAALKNKIESIFPSAKGQGAIVNVDLVDKAAMDADRREYEAALNERQKLEDAAAEKRKGKAKSNAKELANIEKEKANLRIAAMKEGQEREIAAENLRYTELKKQLDRYHIDTQEATEQHNLNLQEIEVKYTLQRIADQQKLIDLRKAQAEFEFEQSQKNFDAGKKRLEEEAAIRESEIDLQAQAQENLVKIFESSGAKKEAVDAYRLESEKEIARQRLESELKLQEGLLLITSAGDAAQVALIKNKIAEIRLALQGLDIPGAKEGEKKSLFDLLGLESLTDGDTDKVTKGLREIADNIKSILNDITAAQVEQAEREISIAEEKVDAAQKFYDEQKALSEQGFANDLDLAQRQLEAAKAAEQRAIEQKKAALKQQQQIDTAQQIVGLVTASANIFKDFSTIPFVGVPLAIAMIATMFGAFIAAKSRAAQAAKFKHGGEGRVDGNSIIVGASHDTGGVGIEAEGGEYFGTDGKRFGIVNKRMTAKHFDLLQAINNDDKGRMREALERLTRPNLRHDAALSAVGAGGGSVIAYGGDKKTHKLLTDIKNKPTKTVTVEGGYVVEREGNYTRRRRIRA